MKKSILMLGAIASLAMVACNNKPAESGAKEKYDVSWVSPVGIPTLAFYDQGNNDKWLSSSAPTTDVVPAFAGDEVDAIVFDGYAGLKNVKANHRNYKLARWISGGTFYVVSVKHDATDAWDDSYTVQAFGNANTVATLAFDHLAKNVWNWGSMLGENDKVTIETGVDRVLGTLTNLASAEADPYDYHLIAQPSLLAATNQLAAKGITLNVIYNLQKEWAATYPGAIIPAAALFVNVTNFSKHADEIEIFLNKTEERVINAVDHPEVAVNALNEYAGGDMTKVQKRFGYQVGPVNLLQQNGANGFNLLKKTDVPDRAALANDFAEKIGQNIVFEDGLFL